MIRLLFLLLLIPSVLNAAAPTRQNSYVTQTTIRSADVMANENAIFSYLQGGVDTYSDGSIVNADIASSAAIVYSKLSMTDSIVSGDISDGTIVNADINASAAIAGSKLDLTSVGAIGSTSSNTGNFTTVFTSSNVGIGTSTASNGRLIVSGGNVGIGTINPGVALDVNGTIRATAFSGIGFYPTNIQAFTSNGTWTKPAGVDNVYVKVWGSGGSGGANTGVGAGGGGGGYAEGITAVTTDVTVTVGAAATACSGVPSTGGNGNTSSFAGTTTISATGGTGGTATVGGSGGTGSNGLINITGASGNAGHTTASSPRGIGGGAFGAGYNSYGAGGNGGINTSCDAPLGGLVIVYY